MCWAPPSYPTGQSNWKVKLDTALWLVEGVPEGWRPSKGAWLSHQLQPLLALIATLNLLLDDLIGEQGRDGRAFSLCSLSVVTLEVKIKSMWAEAGQPPLPLSHPHCTLFPPPSPPAPPAPDHLNHQTHLSSCPSFTCYFLQGFVPRGSDTFSTFTRARRSLQSQDTLFLDNRKVFLLLFCSLFGGAISRFTYTMSVKSDSEPNNNVSLEEEVS